MKGREVKALILENVPEFFSGLRISGRLFFNIKLDKHPYGKPVESYREQLNSKYKDNQRFAALAIIINAVKTEMDCGKSFDSTQDISIDDFKQAAANSRDAKDFLTENGLPYDSLIRNTQPPLSALLENMENAGYLDSRLAVRREASRGAEIKHYFPTNEGMQLFLQLRARTDCNLDFKLAIKPHSQKEIKQSSYEALEARHSYEITFSVLRIIHEASQIEQVLAKKEGARFYGISPYDLNLILRENDEIKTYLSGHRFKLLSKMNEKTKSFIEPDFATVTNNLHQAGYLDCRKATMRGTNMIVDTPHYFLTQKGLDFLSRSSPIPHAV